MTGEPLRLEVDGGVARLTLDRPDELNAFDEAMREALRDAVERLALDSDVRVVVVTGEGRAFSSGGSIAHFERDWNPTEFRLHSHRLSGTFDAIESMEKPWIAALNGAATGAGLQLAMACDLRWASELATLGFREHALGLVPGHGGATRLVKLVGLSRAKGLYFRGELVDAVEAERIGLVHRVLPANRMPEDVAELAADLASRAPASLGLTKRLLNTAADVDVRSGIALEQLAQSIAIRTADHREGVRAFREKRRPVFRGE